MVWCPSLASGRWSEELPHLLRPAPRESVRPRYPEHVDVPSVPVVEARVVEPVGVDATVESLGSLQGELHAVQGARLADCGKRKT